MIRNFELPFLEIILKKEKIDFFDNSKLSLKTLTISILTHVFVTPRAL